MELSITEIIDEKQYTLKQNIFYFLGTKLNLLLFLSCFLFTNSASQFFLVYPIFLILFYRFFFKLNKLSNPYQNIYLLILYHKLLEKIKEKAYLL